MISNTGRITLYWLHLNLNQMLSLYNVNENDVITILKLLKRGPRLSSYSYDTEDSIGFMLLEIGNARLEWQDRGNNQMMFLGVTIGNDRYDLSEPTGELLEELIKATDKEKKRMKYGQTLREKLNIKEDKILKDENKNNSTKEVHPFLNLHFIAGCLIGIVLGIILALLILGYK